MRIRISLLLKKSKSKNNGKCPFYARCVMDGQRIELSTSIFVDAKYWDKSRQEIVGNSQEVRILNNRLLKFVSGIYNIYNQLEAGRDDFDVYIAEELSVLNPEKRTIYNENYLKFATAIDQLDNKIRNTLKDYQGHEFIMFHPSLSYFAREYGLNEYSLEPGGKEPTPQRMAELVKLARKENIRVIYIQSDWDREQARVFAEEIDGEIIEMWPLNPAWEENLMKITDTLIQNF